MPERSSSVPLTTEHWGLGHLCHPDLGDPQTLCMGVGNGLIAWEEQHRSSIGSIGPPCDPVTPDANSCLRETIFLVF